jgi:hypothetical protein
MTDLHVVRLSYGAACGLIMSALGYAAGHDAAQPAHFTNPSSFAEAM